MSAKPTPEAVPADAPAPSLAGSGLLDGAAAAPVDPNPEVKVGKAFAGGLVTAFVLRRLSKRRHRA